MVAQLSSTVTVYAGDPFTLTFRLRDSVSGGLLPLTDYTGWRADWRQSVFSDVTVPFTVTRSGSEVTLSLSAEQTRMVGSGVFDVQAVSSGGQVRTFLRGTIRVEQDVTR